MSTYYNIRCSKCDSELFMSSGYRNDKTPLVWILRNASKIVESDKIFREMPFGLEHDFALLHAGPIDTLWLELHVKHGLLLRDSDGKTHPLEQSDG